jgi:hypothetical protein
MQSIKEAAHDLTNDLTAIGGFLELERPEDAWRSWQDACQNLRALQAAIMSQVGRCKAKDGICRLEDHIVSIEPVA